MNIKITGIIGIEFGQIKISQLDILTKKLGFLRIILLQRVINRMKQKLNFLNNKKILIFFRICFFFLIFNSEIGYLFKTTFT